METIKKKMLSLKSEKEVAIDAKEVAEAELRTSKEREEQVCPEIKKIYVIKKKERDRETVLQTLLL